MINFRSLPDSQITELQTLTLVERMQLLLKEMIVLV